MPLIPGALLHSSPTTTLHELEGDLDLRPSTNVPWDWIRKEKQQTGAASDVTLWDPTADKAVFLHKIIITVSAACTAQITEGADAGGTRLLDVYLAANSGAVIEFPHEAPYKLATDVIVKLTTSAGNAKVTLYGFEHA